MIETTKAAKRLFPLMCLLLVSCSQGPQEQIGSRDQALGETPHLATGAIDDLMAYDWPGNVRELENVIERAMILHRGQPLRFDDVGAWARAQPAVIVSGRGDEPLDLDTVVARHIRRVLNKTNGKIHGPGGAGELLAVNPNTLRYKMRKLGIPFRKYQRLR